MPKRAPRKGEGRPTKYSVKVLKDAHKYLESCVDEYIYIEKGTEKKVSKKDIRTKSDIPPGGRWVVNLPSIAGLAVYLKVSRASLYLWAEEYQEFSDILEQILSSQEKKLLEGGLSNVYNPTLAKLALGKHGYHDKVDSDLTSGGKVIKGVGVILDKAYGSGNSDSDTEEES